MLINVIVVELFYEFYGENKEKHENTVQTLYKNEAGNGWAYNADRYDLRIIKMKYAVSERLDGYTKNIT